MQVIHMFWGKEDFIVNKQKKNRQKIQTIAT